MFLDEPESCLLKTIASIDPELQIAGWRDLVSIFPSHESLLSWLDQSHVRRVLPFLLETADYLPFGESVRVRCHEAKVETWALNSQLISSALPILTEFSSSGMNPILIKGAALVGELYRGIHLRQIGDVDVVLAKKDLNRAAQILREFELVDGEAQVNFKSLRGYAKTTIAHSRNFIGADTRNIDLHWRLSRNIRDGHRSMIGSSRRVSSSSPFASSGVFVPDYDWCVVVAGAHGNRWNTKNHLHIWIDLSRLLLLMLYSPSRDDLESRIFSRASQTKAEYRVIEMWSFLSRLTGIPRPANRFLTDVVGRASWRTEVRAVEKDGRGRGEASKDERGSLKGLWWTLGFETHNSSLRHRLALTILLIAKQLLPKHWTRQNERNGKINPRLDSN